MENGITTESGGARLTSPAMTRLCMVPARQTGIASLCIQILALLMSAILTVLLLFHLNATSIFSQYPHQSTSPEISTILNTTTDNSTEQRSDDMNLTENNVWDMNTILNMNENGMIVFGEDGPQLDYFKLLQISTVAYTGMCILWLLSLISLLVSIKLESLDLITLNSVLLTTVMIYVIIHALFVSIIFAYYKQIPWTTTAIACAVVLGLALTSVISGFALAFNIVWYRYVVYINDTDQCRCLSTIAHFFKHHRKQRTTEYSIPEATHHSNLPYANEPVVQNFSRL